MSGNNLTLSILITTIDQGIEIVISKMIWQFSWAYEIIVSHQITDDRWIQDNYIWPDNVKYVYEHSRWLSRNRNYALSYATGDICYICDDDIDIKSWCIDIITSAYQKYPRADVITFEAENLYWKKRYGLKSWKHNFLSFLKISSIGITFQRKIIWDKQILFNERFGLWSEYPLWEEALFLKQCYKQSCHMIHDNTAIVMHPDESTWSLYTEKLARARIMLWKELFWWFWGAVGCMYFGIFHYDLYSKSLWVKKTLRTFLTTLFMKKH